MANYIQVSLKVFYNLLQIYPKYNRYLWCIVYANAGEIVMDASTCLTKELLGIFRYVVFLWDHVTETRLLFESS